MREFDNREMVRIVDEVLFYVWDPIGVSPIPTARGEYWEFVPKVTQLVENSDDPAPISIYLAEIQTELMELPLNKEKCDFIAQLLLDHKEAIREGLA